jgi:glutamine amidotransferase
MQTAVIIDYGSGNLHSAGKALQRAAREGESQTQVQISSDPAVVASADRLILPGVGAFADCRRGLQAVPGLLEALNATAMGRERPFLGICVGMQLMASRGLEFGVTDGFGWIPGEVKAIAPSDSSLKIPHMGWNTLNQISAHPLLVDIPTGSDGLHAYFVHSYHLVPDERAHLLAETNYGGSITAMVARDHLAGTQFHPEKSQTLGLKLLANFLKWSP